MALTQLEHALEKLVTRMILKDPNGLFKKCFTQYI